MIKNNLVNLTGSLWNESVKSFTKLCSECEFYRKFDSEDRCYWGVAYKVLDKTKILSYCQLINKPSPRREPINIGNQ